jgi:phytanoyl-CoA hydroxylase
VGFWIPLQDATLKNGCLWGIPGSHKGKLYQRHKVINGESVDEILHPVDFKREDFVPMEMKRGDLAIFSGRFVHRSNANTSENSRYAYTWHMRDNNTKWSADNWLQRQSFPKFPVQDF